MTSNKSELPIHVVEDHNDVLYHILRGIGSKTIPFNDNILVHFDSHPDLLIPSELESSSVFEIDSLLEQLSIENWILPAAFAGHITTIIWIKPHWANQIDSGDYKFYIGRDKVSSKIRVTSDLLYFIGEMLYRDEEELEDKKEITLHVIDFKDQDFGEILLTKINERKFILDIDLDFFSTMNPFKEMYKEVLFYDNLTSIYYFKSEGSPKDDQLRRMTQLNRLKQVFSSLHQLQKSDITNDLVEKICKDVELEQRNKLTKLIINLNTNYDDIDWEIVHDAGCTCDDDTRVLPHYISTEEEIDSMMNKFKNDVVMKLARPLMVTMARSSLDDYSPPDTIDSIQHKTINILKKSYDIKLQLHYNAE